METTGRTVTEALEAALDQLGVDEQDAEVVIVEEPKAGLFGLRRAPARVRARVRPTSPRPKRQQRDRRGRSDSGSGDSRRRDRVRRDEVHTGPATGSPAAAAADNTGDGATAARTSPGRTSGANGGGGSRRRRGGGGGGREGQARGGTADPQRPRPARRPDKPDTEERQMSIEEQATLAHEFVAGLVERLGMTASTQVSTSEELETIDVSVDGDGLGLLIGPHGATLGALQELTRTVVQRHTSEHSARVTVDVAGYRAKRAAALAQFARRIVDEVLASGTPHALEPMSASDRKIVHDTVNELEGVSTSSEGEGDDRHVVIRAAATPSTAAEVATAEDDGYQAGSEADEVTDAR